MFLLQGFITHHHHAIEYVDQYGTVFIQLAGNDLFYSAG